MRVRKSAAAPASVRDFASVHASLLDWYDEHRRDLPWRQTSDAYAIWLSEVMCQQTRIETVIPYYLRFLSEFPTVMSLAEAPLDRVLTMWSGLGYYRRARMLHGAAQQVVAEHGGRFPEAPGELRKLSGVGQYTAGAIASIAYGVRASVVDGNVVRVLSRLFAIVQDMRGGAGLQQIWAIADSMVPTERPGDWNQALMELGATVCTPQSPQCGICPLQSVCEGRRRGIERDLPRLAPKAKPKRWRRVALVATDERGAVLLARRVRDGLFGGLWEPPSVDADGPEEGMPRLGAMTGLTLKKGRCAHVGSFVHILSHRRIEADVCLVKDVKRSATTQNSAKNSTEYDRFEWVDTALLSDRAMTKFARKVLNAAPIG